MSDGNWIEKRDASVLIDASGKIIGRVSERSYPHWGEWTAEANNDHIGVFASEGQAKDAVVRAAAPTPNRETEKR